MKIFITGISGFLGCELAGFLSRNGFEIGGCSSKFERPPELKDCCLAYQQHSFGETPQASWFSGYDAVVHCAIQNESGSKQLNISSTLQLYSAANQANVPFQVFVSSHSSRENSHSEYGATKYEIERYFIDRDQTVVRPGLIVGKGGLFQRNRDRAARYPLLFLPAAHTAPVFYVSLSDLLFSMKKILENKNRGEFNLFFPGKTMLGDFVLASRGENHFPKFVLSLPLCLLISSARLSSKIFSSLKKISAQFAVLEENVSNPDYYRSNLEDFVGSPESISEAAKHLDTASWNGTNAD